MTMIHGPPTTSPPAGPIIDSRVSASVVGMWSGRACCRRRPRPRNAAVGAFVIGRLEPGGDVVGRCVGCRSDLVEQAGVIGWYDARRELRHDRLVAVHQVIRETVIEMTLGIEDVQIRKRTVVAPPLKAVLYTTHLPRGRA